MQHLVATLILFLCFPASVIAGTLTGVVDSVVPPYLLIRNESGFEVVRLLDGGALGNMDSLGHLKTGKEQVTVDWSGEQNRVRIATAVTRIPVYTVYPALEVPAEQAATWHDMESGPEKRLMIDVRTRTEWEEGHVLRSISAPFDTVSVPYSPHADRHQKIILYGENAQSNSAHRAAQGAIAAGYSNIRVYSGGVDDWSGRGKPLGITAAGAQRRLDRKQPLLVVDIRDAAAWQSGHIPGSLSAPANTFSPDILSVRNLNHPYPVLLVGKSENECLSLFSVKSWGRNYNAPIYLLEGGFDAWRGAGYPVAEGGQPASADVLPAGEIGPDEFTALWKDSKADSTSIILNVRDYDDPAPVGQPHIPFHELASRMKELPKDREIIIYCYTGTRAGIAYHMLKNNGYRVRVFKRTVRVGENGELLE